MGFAPANSKVTPSADPNFGAALAEIDFAAVKQSIKNMLVVPQDDIWPADYDHYGPFMIRLAWHCAGSYRASDGRGGCDGGRMRFDPERSWEDNTNLDKARNLLWPIKQQYGLGLSWGDLIILAGDAAIESMGGPTLGFCGGRIDDLDGSASLELGPGPEQEALYPCTDDGACDFPLGPTTLSLIYVNPEGPKGDPNASLSALDVRSSFSRMGMNDSETVALTGGGHAFGKTHGNCYSGHGAPPNENEANPWQDACDDPFEITTSGFEGSWTSKPTEWDNEYFRYLRDFEWDKERNPLFINRPWQWHDRNNVLTAPDPFNPNAPPRPVMMLTADLALKEDPSYNTYVVQFANSQADLDRAFSHAWYKLTARDMGPVDRCVGNLVPAAQPWQYPLPAPPSALPDFSKVREDIVAALSRSVSTATPDTVNGAVYYGAQLIELARRCAGSFRATDYLGGCNGARIRFNPQLSWDVNAGLDATLDVLQPIKSKYASLTWADLIVYAGHVAIEQASGATLPAFCPGRSDATEGGPAELEPLVYPADQQAAAWRERVKLSGLTNAEAIAIRATPLSPILLGVQGKQSTWTRSLNSISNQYFRTLIGNQWISTFQTGVYRSAADSTLYMYEEDMQILWNADLLAIAQQYAQDNDFFLASFGNAWTKFMNMDRFDGPTGNKCTEPSPEDSTTNTASEPSTTNPQNGGTWFVIGFAAAAALGVVGYAYQRQSGNRNKGLELGTVDDSQYRVLNGDRNEI